MTIPAQMIADLRAAQQGSRYLSRRVAIALGTLREYEDQRCERHEEFPDYTESVDAALTLVPEEWGWSLRPIFELVGSLKKGFIAEVYWSVTVANTPALALATAALEARRMMEGK